MNPNQKRTTITITESLYEKAQQLMRARDFSDFSSYLHDLIRADYDRQRAKLPAATREEIEAIVREILQSQSGTRPRPIENPALNEPTTPYGEPPPVNLKDAHGFPVNSSVAAALRDSRAADQALAAQAEKESSPSPRAGAPTAGTPAPSTGTSPRSTKRPAPPTPAPTGSSPKSS